eukprot:9477591-Pyramimonas_sp.AAC.1
METKKADAAICAICRGDVDLDEPLPDNGVTRMCNFCGLCAHSECVERFAFNDMICQAASGQLSRHMSSIFGSREAGVNVLKEGLELLGDAFYKDACLLCMSGCGLDYLFESVLG